MEIVEVREKDYVLINDIKVVKRKMFDKDAPSGIENGLILKIKHSFGNLQLPIRKNAHFTGTSTIIYTCGSTVVFNDLNTKKQIHLPFEKLETPITAINTFTSVQGETSIAIASAPGQDSFSRINVLVSSTRKQIFTLVHQLPKMTILDAAFLYNGKFLVSLSALQTNQTPKVFTLSIFKVQKEKLICFKQIEIGGATKIEVIDPYTKTEFIVWGKYFCKIYTLDMDIKSIVEKIDLLAGNLNSLNGSEISECAYLSDDNAIVFACADNKLILFKDYKLIGGTSIDIQQFSEKDESYIGSKNLKMPKIDDQETLVQSLRNIENKKNSTKPIIISAISAINHGVIVGYQGCQFISIFSIETSTGLLAHKGSYRMKEESIHSVTSIDVSEDGSMAIVSLLSTIKNISNNSQNARGTSSNPAVIEEERQLVLKSMKLEVVEGTGIRGDPFETVFEIGVHKANIVDLAICPTRNIVASISDDRTAKWIQYENNRSLIQLNSTTFHEPPLSIAIHPLALQCAIGFKEGMKIFYVLDDELKHVFTSATKICTALCYSQAGHLLAAANREIVSIYNPYDYTLVMQLNGHAAPLSTLEWSDNDKRLISTCQGGVLNVWDLTTENRIVEYAYKTHKVNAVTYDSEFDLVLCACADNQVRIFKEKGLTLAGKLDTSPQSFTAILIDKRFEVAIFGTSDGKIRVYLWPFWDLDQLNSMEYFELKIHSSPVTSIKVTNDFKFLVTSSEDGSIFFSAIREFVEGQDITLEDYTEQQYNQQDDDNNNNGGYLSTFSMNQLCLCSSVSHQIKKESIKELEFKLQNCKSDIEDEKEKWEDLYSTKIKTLKELHNEGKQKQKNALSSIYNNHEENFGKLKHKLEDQKSENEDIVEVLVEKNARDLMSCYQVKDMLMEECSALRKKYQISYDLMKNQYNSTFKKVSEDYDAQYNEMFTKLKDQQQKYDLDHIKYKQVLDAQEADYEEYFNSTKEQLKQEQEEELKRTDELRSSNSKFYKEIQNYKDRQNYLSQESDQLTNEINALESDKESFQEKYGIMTKQLAQKEEIINLREQQIKELRYNNDHLHNFQKVYDYQVNFLKDERMPLKDRLHQTDANVKGIYHELLQEAGTGKKISNDSKKQAEYLETLKKQLAEKQSTAAQTSRLVDTFEYSILDMLRNPKLETWPKRLMQIYKEHFGDSSRLDKVISKSIIGQNLKEMTRDPFVEQMEQEQQFLIGQDLKGQRDFLARQLVKVAGDYKVVMQSRNDAYLRVQNMNTLLINECNKMREEKMRLKDYLGVQKKAHREVKRQLATLLGINFNHVRDNDDLLRFSEDDEDDSNNTNNLDSHRQKDKNLFVDNQDQDEQRPSEEIQGIIQMQEAYLNNLQKGINKGSINSSSIQGKSLNSTSNHFLSKSAANFNQSKLSFHSQTINNNNSVVQGNNPKGSLNQNIKNIQNNQLEPINTSQKLQPIQQTDKKLTEKLLIQDLLNQIGDQSQPDDSDVQGEKLKQKVQFFLTQDRKDAVGSSAPSILPSIKNKQCKNNFNFQMNHIVRSYFFYFFVSLYCC